MPVRLLNTPEPQWPAHLPPIQARRGSAAHKTAQMVAAARSPRATSIPPVVQQIIAQIARRYEVTAQSIVGGSQYRPLPDARAELAAMLHYRGYSLSRIGLIMGKHHTSVLSMIRRAKGQQAKPADPFADGNYCDESGIWAI